MSTENTFHGKALEVGTKTVKLDPTKSIQEQINNFNFDTLSFDEVTPDTQIKMKQQRAPKRKFSQAYKLQILNAFDACKDAQERGALWQTCQVFI